MPNFSGPPNARKFDVCGTSDARKLNSNFSLPRLQCNCTGEGCTTPLCVNCADDRCIHRSDAVEMRILDRQMSVRCKILYCISSHQYKSPSYTAPSVACGRGRISTGSKELIRINHVGGMKAFHLLFNTTSDELATSPSYKDYTEY